ncbi:hypothetical protein L204_102329 [Cryptococcus depauperatus]|nr:hypothetical protein L204_05965 [Cryptococcus depauperatus CBS 7855]
MSAWRACFRSPSPSTDEEGGLPQQYNTGGYVDLVNDLDLSFREDKAVYCATPSSIAKMKSDKTNARKIGNIIPAKDRANCAYVPREANITSPRPKISKDSRGRHQKNARESIGKEIVTGKHLLNAKSSTRSFAGHDSNTFESKTCKNQEELSSKNGGILVNNRLPKPSILDAIRKYEVAEEKKAKRREDAKDKRKKSTQTKKNTDKDKIEFRRLPKGAGPTDEYPILMALDKQRSLPQKVEKPIDTLLTKRNRIPSYLKPRINSQEIDNLISNTTNQGDGGTMGDAMSNGPISPETWSAKRELMPSTSTLINEKVVQRTKINEIRDHFRTPACTVTPASSDPEHKKPYNSSPRISVEHRVNRVLTSSPDATSIGCPSIIVQTPSLTPHDKHNTMATGLSTSNSPLAGRGKSKQMLDRTVFIRDNQRSELHFSLNPDTYRDRMKDEFQYMDTERLGKGAKGFNYQYKLQPTSSVLSCPVPQDLPFPVQNLPLNRSTPEWSISPTECKSSKTSRRLKYSSTTKPSMPSMLPIPCLTTTSSSSIHESLSLENKQAKSPPRKRPKLKIFTPTPEENGQSSRALYTLKTIRGNQFMPAIEKQDLNILDGKAKGSNFEYSFALFQRSNTRQDSTNTRFSSGSYYRAATPEAGPSRTSDISLQD